MGIHSQLTQTNGLATVSFTYDAATLAFDTETITYNLPGLDPFTRVLDRSQDSLQRPTGFTLGTPGPGPAIENAATYAYSPTDGRLSQISNPQLSNVSFTYSYLPDSNLIEKVTATSGAVHDVTHIWEPTRNVLASRQNKVGTTVISQYDYTVNALGQRTHLANSANSALTWDAENRLIEARVGTSGPLVRYAYDAQSRRIAKEVDGATTVYVYDGWNVVSEYSTLDLQTLSA